MRTHSAFISVASVIAFSWSCASAQSPASATSSTPAPELTRADLESWLDGFFPYALQQADIAGAVVSVVKDGEVLLQKGYGYADVAKRTPMDPERTIMRVGSISKLFTWTAVMQQVEQGKLDLDRDINDYLDFKIPPRFDKPITLRHLMTHTAGFEERNKQYQTAGSAPGSPLSVHLKATPPPERIYAPGEVPAYSNYGTALGGYLVERVSGEPFMDYIERHILKPLDMQRSTFRRQLPEHLRADLAKNYHRASGEPLPPYNEEPEGAPNGDLTSTAGDIARFMLAHLREEVHEEPSLLRPDTMRLMHTPAFVPLPGAQGIALGFFRGDYNGHRVIGHPGDKSGFHMDLQLLPDDGVGYFIALNSDGAGGVIGAAYKLRASLFPQFMDRYFPAEIPEEPTASTASEHARLAAGEYEMSRRPTGDFMKALYLMGRAPIKANEDGTIETPAFLSVRNGRPQTWREIAPFVWREVGGRTRLNMKVASGEVQAWLPDNLSGFVIERVPFLWSAALNVPSLLISVVALLLTTLLWPVAAVVRRCHGRKLDLGGREGRAYRLTRLAAALSALYLMGWLVLLAMASSAPVPFNAGFDPWIRLIQLIGLLCVAGAIVAVWNAWLTWTTGRRSGWGRAWSVVLAFALLDLVWFSFAFDLLSVSLNY
jgi:CubicO group peptidase (beta-lactamase class C family)